MLKTLQAQASAAGLSQVSLREADADADTNADVTWLPMLDAALKWGALRTAAAFILPSHQENFGIAVAEALGCGRPVLISNQVNIWREIDAAGAGLVAPDTTVGVIELLTRWQDLDAAARLHMGRAAAACFAANFEIGRAATSLVDVERKSLGT